MATDPRRKGDAPTLTRRPAAHLRPPQRRPLLPARAWHLTALAVVQSRAEGPVWGQVDLFTCSRPQKMNGRRALRDWTFVETRAGGIARIAGRRLTCRRNVGATLLRRLLPRPVPRL